MSPTVDVRRAWLDPDHEAGDGDGEGEPSSSPVEEVIWPEAAEPSIGIDRPPTALSYCGYCPTVFSTTPCCG